MSLATGSALVGWIDLRGSLYSPSPLPDPIIPSSSLPVVETAAPVVAAPVEIVTTPTVAAAQRKPAVPPSVPLPSPPAVSRAADAPRFYGSLVIDSVPPNARAFINGEAVGVTPLVLADVPVGSRAIRLEADEHVSWFSTVRVVAGEQTRVSATLVPSR